MTFSKSFPIEEIFRVEKRQSNLIFFVSKYLPTVFPWKQIQFCSLDFICDMLKCIWEVKTAGKGLGRELSSKEINNHL